MKQWSYVNSAATILSEYKGGEPFASFIKKYFAQHKKYGSKDRKQISHLCYCYFRLGKSFTSVPIEERILIGLFFCSLESNEILAAVKPEWNDKVSLSLKEKCSMLNDPGLVEGYSIFNVFPWVEELSAGIDHEKFCESFLIQPDLFIRIRPHHAEEALLKLDEAGVEYGFISPFTVRLPNGFKAEAFFEINKEVVIQDYSSQQIMHLLPVDHEKPLQVWDCCAASGGKSIMVYDINPHIELTVSDIRESILANLKKRFDEAGI
jgi:16S rRNA (cytosine967-C5)-methyltransferase